MTRVASSGEVAAPRRLLVARRCRPDLGSSSPDAVNQTCVRVTTQQSVSRMALAHRHRRGRLRALEARRSSASASSRRAEPRRGSCSRARRQRLPTPPSPRSRRPAPVAGRRPDGGAPAPFLIGRRGGVQTRIPRREDRVLAVGKNEDSDWRFEAGGQALSATGHVARFERTGAPPPPPPPCPAAVPSRYFAGTFLVQRAPAASELRRDTAWPWRPPA